MAKRQTANCPVGGKLIDKRIAEYRANPEAALDWDDVIKELEAEDEESVDK